MKLHDQKRARAVPLGSAHLSYLSFTSPSAAIKKSIGNPKLQFSIEGGRHNGHDGQQTDSYVPVSERVGKSPVDDEECKLAVNKLT